MIPLTNILACSYANKYICSELASPAMSALASQTPVVSHVPGTGYDSKLTELKTSTAGSVL